MRPAPVRGIPNNCPAELLVLGVWQHGGCGCWSFSCLPGLPAEKPR